MQPAGAISQPNWDSLSTMESTEVAEVMAQLLSSYSLSSEHEHEPRLGFPSIFSADHGMESSYYSDHLSSASYHWPPACSGSTPKYGGFLPLAGLETCYLSDPSAAGVFEAYSVPMDFCMVEAPAASSVQVLPEQPLGDNAGANEDMSSEDFGESGGTEPISVFGRKSSPKRKIQVPPLEKPTHEESTVHAEVSPKKKRRAAVDVQRNGKSVQQKKGQRSARNGTDAEENNAAEKEKGCSSYSSEDDSSASHETNGGAGMLSRSESSASLTRQGRTRAGRGSATDPQSLYARKRRERINERLRILQNLVPNGTKVDISTMLEEAVQYVKFLQLQIKLLSSDDLWMYAPLAWDGHWP